MLRLYGVGGFAVGAYLLEKHMTKRTTRAPIPFADPDGTPCVRVPLSNGRDHAELYADDYAALIAGGVEGNWQCIIPNRISRRGQRAYVQGWMPAARPPVDKPNKRTARTIAPRIVGALQGQRVHYRDGNTLNLRRCNLEIAGQPKADTAAVTR